MQNPFKILGISESASIEEIKIAFKKKALKCHPDHNKSPTAEEDFQKLVEAYQTALEIKKFNIDKRTLELPEDEILFRLKYSTNKYVREIAQKLMNLKGKKFIQHKNRDEGH